MSLLHAILLALVQGVTEFLPISSSAHLILVPYLFGWPDQGLAFDVATNTGTLAAVILYFRRDLLDLARGVWAAVAPGRAAAGGAAPAEVEGMAPLDLLLALVVGTVPVALVGATFYRFFAGGARNPLLIATTSIVFGLALGWSDRVGSRSRELARLRLSDAVWIGLAQAVALLPGTSRSGITMTAALLLGFARPAAARFSFLLAIPVGVLAAGKDLLDVLGGHVAAGEILPMVVGFVVSAVAAYAVIGWLLAWLKRQTMTPFVVYRVLLGLVILGLAARL